MSGIYDEEILGARQQQETARRLREGVKTPEGQMVSGWYVRPSVTQYMAEALKSYYAGKSGKEAQTKYDTLTKQKKDETARFAKMLNPEGGQPAFQAPAQFEERDLLPGDTMTSPLQPSVNTQPNDQNTMAGLLGLSRVNPEAAASAMAILQWQQGRQDKQRALNHPKWEISERFNQQTGKSEKVMVDMNNPTNVMPFGGQEASTIDYNKPFMPDGTPNAQYQQYATEKARAGAANTVINTGLEKAEQKAKGEVNVGQYKDIQTESGVARKLNAQIDVQTRLLDKGFTTGWGKEAIATGANFLTTMGVAPDKATEFASNAQTFKAAALEIVLQKQLMQKGPQTESDAKRLVETGSNLANTPQANRFILDVARSMNNRTIQQHKFYDDYWRKNKTFEGAENAWYSDNGGMSLFDDPVMKKYTSGTSGDVVFEPAEEARYQAWKAQQGK